MLLVFAAFWLLLAVCLLIAELRTLDSQVAFSCFAGSSSSAKQEMHLQLLQRLQGFAVVVSGSSWLLLLVVFGPWLSKDDV